jgi:energy-coupling factor transport system substrate-specific component
VTWQLSSFALLALALAAGFAWYDRARPSAKVVALVATLAALAALGRVAFAPLPSVKPTTDIVLLSGYVLGGPPGFVVGAVGGLASNIFFGQGPFTPWQMAAWGAVGLFGALLARLFGRDLGRWSLAGACMISGFAYGAFLDLSLWVQYAGQHTWAEYAVIAGRGLPFNVTHAVGNAVFCLAFGPLLVRALQRYRDRLQIEWKPVPAGSELAAVAIALLVVLGTSAGDARAADRAQTRAISYLRATADSARTAVAHRASCSRAGPCSAWSPLGVIRAACAVTGARRSTTSSAGSGRCDRSQTSSGRSSRWLRRGARRGPSAGATSSPSSPASGAPTGRSAASSTRPRSRSWRFAPRGGPDQTPRSGLAPAGLRASATATAASTSAAVAARAASTTQRRRYRRSLPPASAAARRYGGRERFSPGARTRTAACP